MIKRGTTLSVDQDVQAYIIEEKIRKFYYILKLDTNVLFLKPYIKIVIDIIYQFEEL
jgi:hypothetical protein